MLTPQQIRPYVSHEDRFIRLAAVEYLAESWSQDETLVPDIVRLCDRYGDRDNVRGLAACHRFPITEEALLGLLDQLSNAADEDVQIHLSRAVGHAPLELLAKHEAAVSARGRLHEEARERIRQRREFAGWSGEQLWQELQDFAQRSQHIQYVNEIDLDSAETLVAALAPHKVPDTATICHLLSEADGKEGDGWREIFLIDLAGERRERDAIPLLVGKFRVDTDFMLERTVTALAKIANPQAVKLITSTFLDETWDFRNYATAVLGAIKCAESEETILALLESEKDAEIRMMFCYSLCRLFSAKGVDVVRRQIKSGYDEGLVNLEESLLPVCDVLGIELADASKWRRERVAREAAFEKRRMELETYVDTSAPVGGQSRQSVGADLNWSPASATASTFTRSEERVGRNDPCPCGSRSKFKKCCGKS